MAVLNSCCRCCTLRTGTIVTGALSITLALLTFIYVIVSRTKFKTIVMDWLPPDITKIIICINLAMTVLISAFLILGTIRRNKIMMIPWVVLGLMIIFALLISSIYTTVELLIHDDVAFGIAWLIVSLIVVAIYTYLWLVVFSFFQTLHEESKRGPYRRPIYAPR